MARVKAIAVRKVALENPVQRSLGITPMVIVAFLLLAALCYYFYRRSKISGVGTQYTNAEKWQIVRDADGMISEVIIHRDAVQK